MPAHGRARDRALRRRLAGPDPLQHRRPRDRRLRHGARSDPDGMGARPRRARVGGRDAAASPGCAPDRLGARVTRYPFRRRRRLRCRLARSRAGSSTASSRAPIASPRTATWRTRSGPTRSRWPPIGTGSRSTSSRRRRRSIRRRRPAPRSRSRSAIRPRSRHASPAWNPAFDVTPAELVAAIVTEAASIELRMRRRFRPSSAACDDDRGSRSRRPQTSSSASASSRRSSRRSDSGSPPASCRRSRTSCAAWSSLQLPRTSFGCRRPASPATTTPTRRVSTRSGEARSRRSSSRAGWRPGSEGSSRPPFRRSDGRSFLEVKLSETHVLERALDAVVPVALMTSFATDDAIREHVREHGPRRAADLQPVRLPAPRSDGRALPSTATAGRRSTRRVTAISSRPSGAPACSARSRERGVRYATVSNVDNLGARVEPAVIGMHVLAGTAAHLRGRSEGRRSGRCAGSRRRAPAAPRGAALPAVVRSGPRAGVQHEHGGLRHRCPRPRVRPHVAVRPEGRRRTRGSAARARVPRGLGGSARRRTSRFRAAALAAASSRSRRPTTSSGLRTTCASCSQPHRSDRGR